MSNQKNEFIRQAMLEAYRQKRQEIRQLPDAPPPPAPRSRSGSVVRLRWAAAAAALVLVITLAFTTPAAAWAGMAHTLKMQVETVRLRCEELLFGPSEDSPALLNIAYTLSAPPEDYLEASYDANRYSAHTMWRKGPGYYLYLSQQCFGVEAEALISGDPNFNLAITSTDSSLYTKVGYAAGGLASYQWKTEEYSFILLIIGPDAETLDLPALAQTLTPRPEASEK